MFLGEYYLQFTAPGRLVLPHKFRQELGEEKDIVLSRGLDGCIWGFGRRDWEKEAERQLEIPVTNQEAREIRRYLFSAAEIVSLDEQGRFIIPKVLVAYSELKQMVVVVGAGDHFEIWDSQNWKTEIEKIVKKTAHETTSTRKK